MPRDRGIAPTQSRTRMLAVVVCVVFTGRCVDRAYAYAIRCATSNRVERYSRARVHVITLCTLLDVCVWHACAGGVLIFPVSFQV